MTVTAWGLVTALGGAVIVAITTVKDPGGGIQGNVSWLVFRLRRSRLRGWEGWVDRWGAWLGWVLVVFGITLQLS